jgi:peptidoglycan-associated lipoprotein
LPRNVIIEKNKLLNVEGPLMLKLNNAIKYTLLAGAAFALTACANTNKTVVDTQPPAEEKPVVEDTGAVDVPEVSEQDMGPGYAVGSQDHLDAIASASLVYFGYDRYDLTSDARSSLQAQAKWMGEYPSVNLVIEGHCDERGTREYNLALGERRANAVRNYLVALGVDSSRLNVVSYGKERPLSTSDHDQNRRGYSRVK